MRADFKHKELFIILFAFIATILLMYVINVQIPKYLSEDACYGIYLSKK